jgi:hypothetical protein
MFCRINVVDIPHPTRTYPRSGVCILCDTLAQEERGRFVKFAWGQERLPATDAEFDAYPRTRMLIKACTINVDGGPAASSRPGRAAADSLPSYLSFMRRATEAGRPGAGSSGGGGGGGDGKPDAAAAPAPLTAEQRQRRVDSLFPTADTCFFNVMLPAYSSLDVMRAKLLEIVRMDAWGMDGDDVDLGADGVARARAPRGLM